MKIKEIEKKDNKNQWAALWVSGADATPQKIWEWLWYNGYQMEKFVILFDLMTDEWSKPEKETPIYYLEQLLDEMIDIVGPDKVIKRAKELKEGAPMER